MEEWINYAGRLHVMLVHFPIGLLVTAALVELLAICRKQKKPQAASVVMAGFGAVAAVVATGQGWIIGGNSRSADSLQLVELHRWAGVATTILALVAAIFGLLAHRGRLTFVWPFRLLVIVASVAVIVAAHWGGELIYGEDYFAPPGFETIEGKIDPVDPPVQA